MNVKFFTDADGFYLGSFWEGAAPPDGAIECAEGIDGHRLVDGTWHRVDRVDWEAHFAPPQTVEQWRASEFVKSWQIIAELGSTAWSAIQAYAARPEADHVTRTLITYPPAEIPRASDFVGRLAALLQMDDLAVDDLFKRAKLRKE